MVYHQYCPQQLLLLLHPSDLQLRCYTSMNLNGSFDVISVYLWIPKK
jgi:hypothetical protein